ncbi:MAG: hypothetical protein NTX03_09030 [Bacteroidetes bacterium]|nr:hypothetical protein [Bacteroidota bacterium]
MKKAIPFILILIIFASCDSKIKKSVNSKKNKVVKIDSTLADSFATYTYVNNIHDHNIINKSDRQIDLLYNSVNGYIDGKKNYRVFFHSECLICEPVQKFKDGLLFAKRIIITPNKIRYYKDDFKIDDSINQVKSSKIRERETVKLKFDGGNGSVSYQGMSCNDADYNKVQLHYKTGSIEIDSFINASFFDYDLDSNGEKEQYLIGARSCDQELIILRIIRRPKM